MGRIFITNYKVFSSASPVEKVEWKVYSDADKKTLIYEYTELVPKWFNELRFNVDIDNKPYMVDTNTRAEFRIIEYGGTASKWIEVLPSSLCPIIT